MNSIGVTQQIQRIRRALNELRDQRHVFSEETFGQLTLALLDRMRRIQSSEAEADRDDTNDEIRLVTVMFTDIADSTTIASTLEASEWKNLIATAHQRIASLISRWEGQVGQYLGDGVLSFFGAQHSQEADAIHAVSCALDIIDAIQHYALEIGERFDNRFDFTIRIGISTGRVVVGMIGGATKREFLALGPATNLAARLQSIAGSNEILIDPETNARVRREFMTTPHESVHLKGFDQLTPYLVQARRNSAGVQLAQTMVHELPLPFVDRKGEIKLIEQALQMALEQAHFRAITVTGDVGIGKSRLLHETLSLAGDPFEIIMMAATYETRGQSLNLWHSFLSIQCQLQGTFTPDQVREHVTAYFMNHEALALDEDRAVLPVVDAALHLAGLTTSPQVNHASEKIIEWFTRIRRPILLLVDNLQWADSDSILLIEQIADALLPYRGLLLAAGRQDLRTIHPHYMTGNPQHREIMLNPLDDEATALLISSVTSQVQRTPQSVTDILVKRAEGNPLFVHQYLENLFDKHVFEKQEGTWRFNIAHYDVLERVPAGLTTLFQARLDELPTEARAIVQAAAISGRTFWAGAVREITENDETLALLDTLSLRGIIIAQPQSSLPGEREYTFQHSLYRDVAYNMLPRGLRERYHRLMADWLITHVSKRPENYSLLAEQFHLGASHGAALYVYLEAVIEHIRLNRMLDAMTLIDNGLAIAREVPRSEALPAVSKLWAYRGLALIAMDRYEEASAACESALRLLDEMPHESLMDMRIMTERILGASYVAVGRYENARTVLEHAQSQLTEEDTLEMASVLRSFGMFHYHQGQIDEAIRVIRRAYQYAQITRDRSHLNASLAQLGMCYIEKGTLNDALTCFEQIRQINRQRGHAHYEAKDLRYIGIVYLHLQMPQRALAYFNDALTYEHESSEEEIILQAYRAYTLILQGRRAQGSALLFDAFNRGSKSLFQQQRLYWLYICGLLNLGEASAARDEAQTFLNAVGEHPLWRAKGLRALGEVQRSQADAQALETLHEALKLEMTNGGVDRWLCHRLIAETSADPAEQSQHFHAAADELRRIVDEFANNPHFQAELLDTEAYQHVFEREQASRTHS